MASYQQPIQAGHAGQQPQSQLAPPMVPRAGTASPVRSVGANTWARGKGVTARERQASMRQLRLDPLSADEYTRQQAMLQQQGGGSVGPSSQAGSALNSRRGSLDPAREQQFIRQHGLGGQIQGAEESLVEQQQYQQQAGYAQQQQPPRHFFPPDSSPPIASPSAYGGAGGYYDAGGLPGGHASPLKPNAADAEGPLTPPPKNFISRPARDKFRRGGVQADGTAAPADPMAVTEVLQSIRARQDAAQIGTPGAAPGTQQQLDRRTLDPGSDNDPATAAARARIEGAAVSARRPGGSDGADDDVDHVGGPAATFVAPPPPPPQAMPSLCSCCPCVDSFASLPCSAYLSSLFAGDGKDLARHEMQHGVILPQDASRANIEAVEAVLSRSPGPDPVLQLRLHRTDELQADANIVHPFLRVHLVDLTHGTYWPKSDPSRHAVAPYENMRGADPRDPRPQPNIMPIQSKPFALKSHGSFSPNWDEVLLINEPLRAVLNPRSLLLLELLDFGPHVDLEVHPSGSYPVAWAFLKLLNARGEPNLAPHARLQLYQYTGMGATESWLSRLTCGAILGGAAGDERALRRNDVPRVYYEWLWQKHTGRVRYPASLYLGVGGAAAPVRELVRGMRPSLPTQIEEGRMGLSELLAAASPDELDLEGAVGGAAGKRERRAAVEHMSVFQKMALVRKRRSGEECLLPTVPLHSISCGREGCFVLRYSPDGRTLAAAVGDGLMFTIKLYDADSGAQLHTFLGHHELVHDLAWNCLGNALLTASADCTAKVWLVDSTRSLPAHQQRQEAVQTFQHAAFVYAAVWHPKLDSQFVMVTGGFEGVLRFWDARNGELLHSIVAGSAMEVVALASVVQDSESLQGEGHSAAVNSIVIAPSGTRIFSADADGHIKIWEDTMYTRATDASGMTRGRAAGSSPAWRSRIRLLHTLSHPELVGTSLSCVRFHPRPERLVVFGRDNCLWVFSLLRYELKARLSGVPCAQHALKCTLSPDGTYAVAGGEDGAAHVFDLNTGQLVHVLDVGYRAPLYDLSWHPSQHALALASFGGDYPIKILEYRAGATQPALLASPEAHVQDEQQQRAGSTVALGGTISAAPLPPSLKAQAATAAAVAHYQSSGGAAAAGPPSVRRAQSSLAGTRANPLPPIEIPSSGGADATRPSLHHASTLAPQAKHVTFGAS